MFLCVNGYYFIKWLQQLDISNGRVWCSLRGAYWILKCFLDEHWTQGSVVQTRQKTMDFKGDKVRSTSSFGAEVRPSAPCRKILWHFKNPTNMKKILRSSKIQRSFLLHVSLANRWLLIKVCQRALVHESGMIRNISKIWSRAPGRSSIPTWTDRLTVSRKATSTGRG
jgi:hypothetical protein